MSLTLPIDSDERKEVPLYSGCLMYFPAALAGVARHSKQGNDKHNPGEPMHHARWKSMDHMDCIARHCIDIGDLLAAYERGGVTRDAILAEASAICWRALAASQMLHERFGAPLAPAAREAPLKREMKQENPDPGRAWLDCQPHNETLSTGDTLPPKPLCVDDDSIPGVKCAACEE